jgi:hypothetical protein
MSVSVKTKKILWGRAANRCAFPECKIELVMDATDTDDESVIGEECHIVAREDDGPRGDRNYPKDKRDKYENLLLLCSVHHKKIDDQQNFYTIEKLKEIKKVHEDWVRSALDMDEVKLREELIYSTYIDEWVKKADLENWTAWTSWLLGSGQPNISISKMEELESLNNWLFSRIMPQRYTELEDAFENFRLVLQDLISVFYKHAEESNKELITKKFYRIDYWDEELHSRLHKEFSFHVDLVMDLTLELTRAANYLCDKVRKFLLPNFRLDKGILVVTSGPFMDFSFRTYRPQYKGNERINIPYKNKDDFMQARISRDINFGGGTSLEKAQELGIEY